MISTIIIFIIVLGLLVFVHEWGHFIVAKKSGMKVDEFGFGFPPRMIGIQKTEGKWKFVWGHRKPLDQEQTVYSINWIPLGGFVKIVGENNDHQDDPRSFINKGFWPRFLTLVAGVTMNALLAWALFSAGFMAGLPVAVSSEADLPGGAQFSGGEIAILEVVPQSPADKAGLKPNDIILSLDGNKYSQVSDLSGYIKQNSGKTFSLEYKRGEEVKTAQVESVANPPEGSGPTGIALAKVGKLKFPWYKAIGQGFKTTYQQLGGIVSGFGQLITGKVGVSSLGGPVKIAQLTGEVADMGLIYLVQFTAFLSLNLAVLNILPFPALDGGRVLFLIIEKLRRKRNNPKWEQIANTAGFLLLIMLMIAVTIQDIIKK